ncbi:hypothetical protein BDQ17DRAFT_1422707 [Cyathus striatus]|nr:hypothetical protein BDQ17DRAFT_1422707 [Cyathus striatus]
MFNPTSNSNDKSSGGLDYYAGKHSGGNFGGNGKGGQAYYVRFSPSAVQPQRIGGTSTYPPHTDDGSPRHQSFSGSFNGGNFGGNGEGRCIIQMGNYPSGDAIQQTTQTQPQPPAIVEIYKGHFDGGNFGGNRTGGQVFEICVVNEADLLWQIRTYGLDTTSSNDADMYMGPHTHNYDYHAGGNYGGIRQNLPLSSDFDPGNSTVEDYTAVFETLWPKIGLDNDAEKIRRYKKGLNRPLQEKVETQSEVPTEYAKYKAAAIKFDRNYLRFKETETSGNARKISPINFARKPAPFTQYLGARPSNGSHVDSYHPSVSNQMDTRLDAIRTPLTTAEVIRFRKEGRCFVCKKIGHISRECPDKKGGRFYQKTGTNRNQGNRRDLSVRAAFEEIGDIYRSLGREDQDEVAKLANEQGF